MVMEAIVVVAASNKQAQSGLVMFGPIVSGAFFVKYFSSLARMCFPVTTRNTHQSQFPFPEHMRQIS